VEVAMSGIRARLERLEKRRPPAGGINWDNLWRSQEHIVPDGIIDWDAMYEPMPAEDCPIERAIAEAGRRLDYTGRAPAGGPAGEERHSAAGDGSG
jgi:hypothetical protein